MSNQVTLLVTSESPGQGSGGSKTRYRYYVAERGLFLNLGQTGDFSESEVIGEWTSKTQTTLKRIVEEMAAADPADAAQGFEEYKLHMGTIGNQIAETFVPEKAMDYVRSLPGDEPRYVYINSESHWIPWELIYDREESFFWGEKCIIVRVPMLKFSSRQSKRSVVAPNPRALATVVNIVGDEVDEELQAEDKERLGLALFTDKVAQFDNNYDNGAWEALSISDVKRQGVSASILHFTCHGRFDADVGYHLQLKADVDHPMRYLLDTFSVSTHLQIDDALVFVNACSSAVAAEEYGIFLDLAQEFFKSGGGAIIGTIAPVPIVQAIRLADVFYSHILAGESVGISLYKAKLAMKQEHNPFYLFYCIYGNAYRRFQI